MPDGDSCTLLAEIRKRYPIAAIALSGYGMSEDVARSIRAGFAAHIVKPVCFAELLRRIDEIVRGDGSAAALSRP